LFHNRKQAFSPKISDMKHSLLASILLVFSLIAAPEPVRAAIVKDTAHLWSGPAPESVPESGVSLKKAEKKRGKWAKFKKKLDKKLDKLKRQLAIGDVSTYLLLSLALLLAAIIFFALNGSAGVFNVFGSLAALAAAVFFVLWLFEITGGTK